MKGALLPVGLILMSSSIVITLIEDRELRFFRQSSMIAEESHIFTLTLGAYKVLQADLPTRKVGADQSQVTAVKWKIGDRLSTRSFVSVCDTNGGGGCLIPKRPLKMK